MRVENNKNIDIIVIGSGLSGLNFVDTYLEKKQKVHVISPNFNTIVNDNNRFNNLKALPSQMEGKNIHINNYLNGKFSFFHPASSPFPSKPSLTFTHIIFS